MTKLETPLKQAEVEAGRRAHLLASVTPSTLMGALDVKSTAKRINAKQQMKATPTKPQKMRRKDYMGEVMEEEIDENPMLCQRITQTPSDHARRALGPIDITPVQNQYTPYNQPLDLSHHTNTQHEHSDQYTSMLWTTPESIHGVTIRNLRLRESPREN